MVEQKRQRQPWQSYFWSALLSVVFIGGYFFTAWVWQDGHWVWTRTPGREQSLDREAVNILSSLRANDFKRATAQFDSTMLEAFPPEKLQGEWVRLTREFGPVQSWAPVEHLLHEGRDIGTYLLQFEHGQVRATVTFNSNFQRVTGLCFEPPP